MSYDPDNIFAKILRDEIPSMRVYEDDATLVFMDIMPRTDGHCLVIPKTPCRNLLDASPEQLAAVAATLFAPINLIYPAMGHLVIMKAFVIIILGGMGSIPGAIIGGMIIGFAEAFGGFYFSTAYKDVIAFGLLVLILSIRPQGLFAKGAH